MNKKTIKDIRSWLTDYEKITGEACGDSDTLEGSAYIIFNEVLRDEKDKD